MFRHTIPIGPILGIPVNLDYPWFLIAMPVMVDGHLVGMLSRGDIVHYLQILHDIHP